MSDFPYRAAIRPDHTGALDDVVITDVAMFRLEQMDTDRWWMACYLDDEAEERFSFSIYRKGQEVLVALTEWPRSLKESDYEPGSMLDPMGDDA